ncbi:MAG: lysine transporter LysE [Flavobacteriaceae bacterium]|nr:lysine transporter LysE [Flavobacteriaceae bacterium]
MGPVFWVLLETSITKGLRAAVAFDIGVILADVLFILATYYGSVKLFLSESNKEGLFVLGGTIILLFGVYSWLTRKKEEEKIEVTESKHNYIGLAAKGFAINIFNVGVLIFWGGVTIVAGPSTGKDPLSFVLFFSIVILAYFITDLGKIVIAKQLKVFINGKTIVFVKSLLALILVISGIVLIIGGLQAD